MKGVSLVWEDVFSGKALQREDFSRCELVESPVAESLYPSGEPAQNCLVCEQCRSSHETAQDVRAAQGFPG